MCNAHPHRDLIHAWAEGHQIQVFSIEGWKNIDKPTWSIRSKYRIAPELKPHIHINDGFIPVATKPLDRGQDYWYVCSCTTVEPFVPRKTCWTNIPVDEGRLKRNMVFLTEEDAQRAADKLNAIFANPVMHEVNHDQ